MLVERNAVDHAASQDGHHQRPLDGAVPAARPGRQAARRRGARGEQLRHLLDHARSTGGRELHRFRYPSVVEKRAEIRARNDGTPAARARHAGEPGDDRAGAARRHPRPSAGRGALGRGLRGVHPGRDRRDGDAAHRRDGRDRDGALRLPRRLRRRLERSCASSSASGCEGKAAVAHRYMVHFRSDARDILQAFGVAWHYQTRQGHADRAGRQGHLDPADAAACRRRSGGDRSRSDARCLGRHGAFAREILVANPWFTHLLLAERYQRRPRLPRGRLRAPIHPDRRLRHEHRHRRRRRPRLEARRDAQGLRRAGPARDPTSASGGRSAIAIAWPRSATPACA